MSELSGQRRPFKVRWFDDQWAEYAGRSFATRERADFMAALMADEGCRHVQTWENDGHGYVVPGSMRTFVDKAGRPVTPA